MTLNILRKRIFFALSILIFTSFSFAEQVADKTAIDPAVIDKITAKLEARRIHVISVSAIPVDGLYELITNNGIFYSSKDAKYLFKGDIYDLDAQLNLTNLTKIKIVNSYEDEMIIYKAPEEKHVITVFTDTSCVYCQKLHSQMADYNKFGITVRYLAFPRSGTSPKSSTYNKMVSIWCADDPNKAMDDAKKQRNSVTTTCKNTVKEQYELGLFLGVNGTPAILLEDGTLAPGYIPPARLAQML